MRIGHVTATFPPYYAGTGNVALQNAVAVAERGHEVSVYTPRLGPVAPSHRDPVRVRRLRPVVRIGLASLVPGLLHLPELDLVHLHYPFIFGGEIVRLLERLRGQRYVVTYHNDLLAPAPKGWLFDVYQRMWSRTILLGARKVFVTDMDGATGSPILLPLLHSHPSRFLEIPNGVDTDRFRPGIPALDWRRRLDLDDPAVPVVLFVGAMDGAHHPKGGVPVLLEAAARLRHRRFAVLLVGGGNRMGEYQRLATSLGLRQHVRFVGQVPHDAMPAVYAAADLVVQPSVLFEPFGLVAAEAMACGRPVIASDLPGVRRVVSEAGGGVLARAGDGIDLAAKIDGLLADPAARSALGDAGRAGVVARYEARAVGPRLEAAYRQALEPTE